MNSSAFKRSHAPLSHTTAGQPRLHLRSPLTLPYHLSPHRYDKKFDPKAADFKKLRVKELRKVCDDENIDTKGLVEKEEYVKKIKAHFGIKDEV